MQEVLPPTSNKIYAELSAAYGFDLDNHFPARTRLKLLESMCRPEMDVLDIGCGNGLYALRIADKVKSVTGVDLSQEMMDEGLKEAVKTGIENVKFVLGDASNLSFPDQKFDLVFCYAALFLFPDIQKFLHACHHSLKNDGILIIDVLNRRNFSYLYWSQWYAMRGHKQYKVFTRREISKMLRETGFFPERWMHQGFAEQWKYIPILNHMPFINKLIHWGPSFDLDYILSNLWPFSLATNRWYIAARKK